jgi:hypothetical protein
MFSLSHHEPTPGEIPPPPDYTARSTQWKLLVVVAALMTVLLGLRWVFPEESWRWIVGGRPEQRWNLEPAEVADENPDTRVPRTAPQERTDLADAFVLSPLAAAEPSAPQDDPQEPESPDVVPSPLPQLTEAQKKAVRDDTVYRAQDSDAWFTLLAGLQKAEPEQLAKASEGRVGYIQLYNQPEYYRGRLVTIRGTVRRVEWLYAHANDQGVRGYFRCVLMPAGGPTSPIDIYLLDLPEAFPRGEVNEEVEVHAYFFKRVAYLAQDTTRLAPVLLAKSPIWTPPAARPAPLPPNYIAIGVIVGLTMLAGIAAAWYMFRTTPEPIPAGNPFDARGKLTPEEEEKAVRASLNDLAQR